MLKKLLFVYLLTLISSAQAQKKGATINLAPFPGDTLEMLLIQGLSDMRKEANVDELTSNDILKQASEIQTGYMAKSGKAELIGGSSKHKDTGKRVMACGGSKNAEEIVAVATIVKGKGNVDVKEIAFAILKKWRDSKKEKPIIINGKHIFYGISNRLSDDGKRVAVSITFAGNNLNNKGVKKKTELKVPFTAKNKKIKAPTTVACKNCEKFKDYDSLRSGLYIDKDGYIYLKYHDLKAFKRLFKKPKDGIMIDVVQRDQYKNPAYNIYDNNLFTKGVITKPVYGDKLLKNNRIKDEAPTKGKKAKKAGSIDTKIARFPNNIKGDYEMNLIILQDGQVCKTIIPSYIESGNQQGSAFDMLLMPDSMSYLKPMFKPKSESSLLRFTIPFEKNKFTFKPEDIKPFMDALQEPDFRIDGIYVTAYSSIEGDSVANAQLQKKRANSIIEALKGKNTGIATDIKTSDSWLLFSLTMEDGKYDELVKMGKRKAIKEINSKPQLQEELEPFLAKQRFAEIVLDVVYDIEGAKEEKFCISKFNSAVKKGDIKQAYKIQYYIEKCIREKKFSEEAHAKLEIPKDTKYFGLLMNQVVYDYIRNNKQVTDEHYAELKKLIMEDAGNSYIRYNNIFCNIKLDGLGDKKKMNETQAEIEALYKATDMPKRLVDQLNTEYQFKIMDAMDTVENSEATVLACIEKIKSFYNIKETTWQNSLKLAYMFMKHNEFKYSCTLLEPFLKDAQVNEELLFAYISAAGHLPEKMASKNFSAAMQKANEINHDRYCKLFGEPNLSFQVLDIEQVKNDYFKAKCQ